MSKRVHACSKSDLQDGQMKSVEVLKEGDKAHNVLIARINGQFHAMSAKCSHFGAPLIKGTISTREGCVTCPWHGAKFSFGTGDIEDAPALDNLFTFPVNEEGGDIYVRLMILMDIAPVDLVMQVDVDVGKLKQNNREPGYPQSCRKAASDNVDILLVGGGPASNSAAQTLRELGFDGSITIISSEPYLPIDRTKLSKALIDDPSKIAFRNKQFYADRAIEIKTGQGIQSIDFGSSTAHLDDGTSVKYGKVVLATGASPNRLPLDGADLENIFVLRTIEHTQQINKAVAAATKGDTKPRVVLVGTSFISLEAAVALKDKAKLHVIGMDEEPFQPQLGKEVGRGLRKFHESQGVTFYMGKKLARFEPSSSDKGKVGAVVTEDGTKVEGDIVVLGVGVKPRTDYLQSSKDITLERSGAVRVDEHFKIEGVSQGNAYAIGDIAYWIDGNTKGRSTIQHWNVASNQGRQVAQNIVGKPSPFTKAAVFWSAQGKQLRYVGTSESTEWDGVHIEGKPEDLDFSAYYGKGDKIVAVCTMDPKRDPLVSHTSELMRLGGLPSFSDVKNGKKLLDVPLA